MSCGDYEERVHGWVDGTLSREAHDEVARHLADCPACARLRDGLERLQSRVAALPREVQPPRDLWPGLRDRLPARPIPRERPVAGRLRPWLAAAAVLLAGLAGLLLLRDDAGTGSEPFTTAPAAYGEVEREYRRATDDLLRALDLRREDLSPETLAVVDENIRIIDDAIGRVRLAIENDPNGGDPRRMFALYGSKVRLLRQAVQLPAEG